MAELNALWQGLTEAGRKSILAAWREIPGAPEGITNPKGFPQALTRALEQNHPALSAIEGMDRVLLAKTVAILRRPRDAHEQQMTMDLLSQRIGWSSFLLERLSRLGLVYRMRNMNYTFWYLPIEVAVWIYSALPFPPVAEGPRASQGTAGSWIRSLVRFLARMSQEERIPLTASGRVHKRSAARWTAGLEEPLQVLADIFVPPYFRELGAVAEFCLSFWEFGGVLDGERNREIILDGEALQDLLQQPLEDWVQPMVYQWLSNSPPEFAAVYYALVLGRDDRWRRWDWGRFLGREGSLLSPQLLDLLEGLVALGIVERFQEESDVPLWRLSPIGHRLLCGGEGDGFVHHASLQPNFEVILPPLAAPSLVFAMELLGESRQDDVVTVYELQPARFVRWLEEGLPPDTLMSALRAWCGKIPANVLATLEARMRTFRSITLYRGVSLLTTDEVLRQALRELEIWEPVPGAFLIRDEDLAVVQLAVRKVGVFLPKHPLSLDAGGKLGPVPVPGSLGGGIPSPARGCRGSPSGPPNPQLLASWALYHGKSPGRGRAAGDGLPGRLVFGVDRPLRPSAGGISAAIPPVANRRALLSPGGGWPGAEVPGRRPPDGHGTRAGPVAGKPAGGPGRPLDIPCLAAYSVFRHFANYLRGGDHYCRRRSRRFPTPPAGRS